MTDSKPMRAELVDDYRIKCALLLEEVIDAEESAKLAAAEIAELRAERDRLKAALETIAEEHDAGRHDGLPEPCPAHDADTMFYVARKALGDAS